MRGSPVPNLSAQDALRLWHEVTLGALHRDGFDLTSRQLALLLEVYLNPAQHTVRGLAQRLEISKPAVTRALDRLEALGFLRRKPEPQDRRSVTVQRTVQGSVFLRGFGDMISRHAAPLLSADD